MQIIGLPPHLKNYSLAYFEYFATGEGINIQAEILNEADQMREQQAMKNTTDSPRALSASDLSASGFDLGALRKRIESSLAKAKFKSVPKAEREKRANEAIKIINQLIK